MNADTGAPRDGEGPNGGGGGGGDKGKERVATNENAPERPTARKQIEAALDHLSKLHDGESLRLQHMEALVEEQALHHEAKQSDFTRCDAELKDKQERLGVSIDGKFPLTGRRGQPGADKKKKLRAQGGVRKAQGEVHATLRKLAEAVQVRAEAQKHVDTVQEELLQAQGLAAQQPGPSNAAPAVQLLTQNQLVPVLLQQQQQFQQQFQQQQQQLAPTGAGLGAVSQAMPSPELTTLLQQLQQQQQQMNMLVANAQVQAQSTLVKGLADAMLRHQQLQQALLQQQNLALLQAGAPPQGPAAAPGGGAPSSGVATAETAVSVPDLMGNHQTHLGPGAQALALALSELSKSLPAGSSGPAQAAAQQQAQAMELPQMVQASAAAALGGLQVGRPGVTDLPRGPVEEASRVPAPLFADATAGPSPLYIDQLQRLVEEQRRQG